MMDQVNAGAVSAIAAALAMTPMPPERKLQLIPDSAYVGERKKSRRERIGGEGFPSFKATAADLARLQKAEDKRIRKQMRNITTPMIADHLKALSNERYGYPTALTPKAMRAEKAKLLVSKDFADLRNMIEEARKTRAQFDAAARARGEKPAPGNPVTGKGVTPRRPGDFVPQGAAADTSAFPVEEMTEAEKAELVQHKHAHNCECGHVHDYRDPVVEQAVVDIKASIATIEATPSNETVSLSENLAVITTSEPPTPDTAELPKDYVPTQEDAQHVHWLICHKVAKELWTPLDLALKPATHGVGYRRGMKGSGKLRPGSDSRKYGTTFVVK